MARRTALRGVRTLTARIRRGRPSSVFGAAAVGLGALAGFLAVASCRGERLRDIERGDVDSVSGGGACELPSGGRSEARDAGVSCYLVESTPFGGHLVVSAVQLSSGLVRQAHAWTVAAEVGDRGVFPRGLTHDGERFVVGSDAFEGGCLFLLSPSTGEASCRPVAGFSARAQWTGTDWVAEYAEWGGLGRFPNLDAVTEGGPSRPLVRSTYHQFSVAHGRLYALSSETNTIEVFDLCTGELARTLSLEAPGTRFSELSVTGETLYLLTERQVGLSSIVAFPLSGGAELGRVAVLGSPEGIWCSSVDPLLGPEAGAPPTWTPQAMCDADHAPEASEGGPVTCFTIDSMGGASGRQMALVSVDLSTGVAREQVLPSLPEEPSGIYPSRRALGFDGARFLLTAYDGAGSSWYLVGADAGVSSPGPSRDIAWTPWWAFGVAWTGEDWLSTYAIHSSQDLARFPTPEALVGLAPVLPVMNAPFSAFTATGRRFYGRTSDTLETHDLCSGEKLSRALVAGSSEMGDFSVAGGTLYLLDGRGSPKSIVAVDLDGGAELGRTSVRGSPSGLFCTTRPPR